MSLVLGEERDKNSCNASCLEKIRQLLKCGPKKLIMIKIKVFILFDIFIDHKFLQEANILICRFSVCLPKLRIKECCQNGPARQANSNICSCASQPSFPSLNINHCDALFQ
jgi:hypothetical protein